MTGRVLVLLVGLVCWSPGVPAQSGWNWTAADVQWQRGAGRLTPSPGTRVFVTAFRVDRCDANVFDRFVSEWLALHPGARLRTVAQSPPAPEPARAIYVWIDDGPSASLNLELVEQGICPAASLSAPRHAPLTIPEFELEQMMMQARSRESIARQAQIGIWTPPPVKEEESD